MPQVSLNSTQKLLVAALVILVGVVWTGSAIWATAQAQGLPQLQRRLPLTTAYFYGPVSVSENHLVKMCSNNLFGDGSVRYISAAISVSDGSVLAAEEQVLPRRGGSCFTFRPTQSLEVLGVLWSVGSNWSGSDWAANRASGPVATFQAIDVTTNQVIAIISTPGKVTVDTALLPELSR
jgi:hypothetical protein